MRIASTSASGSRAGHLPAPMLLRTLPRFELEVGGSVVPVRVRVQQLLVLLAVRGGESSRSGVAGTLWPEATDARAFSCLRSTLWALPRLERPLVVVGADRLQLAGHVRTDLEEATRLAHRVIERGTAASPRAALRALRHDLLPHWSEEWIETEQFHFQQLRLHALESLCLRLTQTGRHAQAVEAGLLAVACEPLRESAHRVLIAAHLAEGNRYEAVGQYRRCVALLRSELGLGPSGQLRALLQRALDGDAGVTLR